MGLWRDRTGTSAVEFAIVAPVFLALVFSTVVYGGYFAALALVNHIAYEAARASVTGLTDAERASLATARAGALAASFSGILDSESLAVTTAASNGLFSVTVSQDFDSFGLSGFSFLPTPPVRQSVTVEVSHGGY